MSRSWEWQMGLEGKISGIYPPARGMWNATPATRRTLVCSIYSRWYFTRSVAVRWSIKLPPTNRSNSFRESTALPSPPPTAAVQPVSAKRFGFVPCPVALRVTVQSPSICRDGPYALRYINSVSYSNNADPAPNSDNLFPPRKMLFRPINLFRSPQPLRWRLLLNDFLRTTRRRLDSAGQRRLKITSTGWHENLAHIAFRYKLWKKLTCRCNNNSKFQLQNINE